MKRTDKIQKNIIRNWIKLQKLKELNSQVRSKPLDFKYSTEKIRELNRALNAR